MFTVKAWRCQVELEWHIQGAESRQTAPVSGAAGGWLVEVDKGQVMRGPQSLRASHGDREAGHSFQAQM